MTIEEEKQLKELIKSFIKEHGFMKVSKKFTGELHDLDKLIISLLKEEFILKYFWEKIRTRITIDEIIKYKCALCAWRYAICLTKEENRLFCNSFLKCSITVKKALK